RNHLRDPECRRGVRILLRGLPGPTSSPRGAWTPPRRGAAGGLELGGVVGCCEPSRRPVQFLAHQCLGRRAYRTGEQVFEGARILQALRMHLCPWDLVLRRLARSLARRERDPRLAGLSTPFERG